MHALHDARLIIERPGLQDEHLTPGAQPVVGVVALASRARAIVVKIGQPAGHSECRVLAAVARVIQLRGLALALLLDPHPRLPPPLGHNAIGLTGRGRRDESRRASNCSCKRRVRPLLRMIHGSARHWIRRGRRRITVVSEPELLASEIDERPLRRRLLGRLRRRLRRPARHIHGTARGVAEVTGR